MKKYYYGLAAAAIFSALFWSLPSYFESSETFQKLILETRDVFFKIRHFSTPLPDKIKEIVIVTIDEESCQKLDARWPWSRRVFAAMIDHLKDHRARLVGLNVSFTGLEDGNDESSRELARAMREEGNVVIGATFDKSNRLVKPSPLIAEAASRVGYLEKIVDGDFAIRRSYLVRPYAVERMSGGLAAPDTSGFFESSFPLELLAAYSGPDKRNDPHYDRDLGLVTVGTAPRRGITIDPDGSYTINYLASESGFLKVPAWKVAQGKISVEDVRNKVVLVGLSSSLFSDMHPTPYGLMSGIGIHANEFLSTLTGRELRFVPDNVTFFISWLVGLCVLALFLLRRFWFGFLGSAVAVCGLSIGAQMIFVKDHLMEPFCLMSGTFLATLIGFSANAFRLLWENRGLEKKAIHDKLTGLYKYEYLRECLEEEWKRCRRAKLPVSIVMTDLDHFKKINDALGHEVGNDMIRRAAQVIQQSARRYDVVSRYGGDEFVILLWHSNLGEAKAYRERLRKMYQEMTKTLEPALQDSSISIGVASFDPNVNLGYPPDTQRLIEDADKDLFLDKENRRASH